MSDRFFAPICLLAVLIPNLFLYRRIRIARTSGDNKTLTIGTFDDHRDHLLVYLFAMMLPFYPANLDGWREFGATVAAFLFIVFLFWHLNMHYMNLVFAIFGFRVFTVTPSIETSNKFSGRSSYVLLTKRPLLEQGEQISALRLSNTVYLELGE